MVRVKTIYGEISGVEEENGITAFLGIPYARPPAGRLRFRPPEPPEPWQGIRECTKYGPPSLQLVTENHVTTSKKLKISSEDCLYLNVRTKAPLVSSASFGNDVTVDSTAKMPVYVFIHGGAFETGGSNMKLYEGKRFAEDGVVYVNINYRLGVFGALALDSLRKESGVTGCYHILDIMQAVKWVHENIEAFGGDPDNITIGGESAGAFAVSLLMCMPEMKGKFRRCILESGGIRATATSVHYGHGNPQEAVAHGRMVLEDLGIEDTSEGMLKLRDIPAEELLLKWYFGKDGGLHGFRAGPVLDGLLFEGDLVPDPHLQPPDDVDLLFGFNTDEGTMFADPAMTEPQYINVLQNMFPDNWRKVLERYPADEEHSPYRQLSDIYGLQKFKGAMLPYAEILSDKGMNVYAYHFDYLTDKLRSEGLGVRHIAELPFVFDSFLHTVGADDEAGHDMALIIHNAWVNFIKTGDPGYNWKKYDCKSHTAMRFTMEGIKLQSIERIDEMLWLDGIL